MKKLRQIIKKDQGIAKKLTDIADLELDKIIENKELLLEACVQILMVKADKRTPREFKLLMHMAEGIEFFNKINKSVQQEQLQDLNVIERCVHGLNYLSVAENQKIFNAGDLGSLFYVILRGQVGIYIMLPKASDPTVFEAKEVNVLRAGQSFGELALISEGAQRTATIIAKCQCDLATMEKEDYKVHKFQILGKIEAQKIAKKIYFLNQFPFFQEWSFREMKTLSYHFVEQICSFKQTIYQNGNKSGDLYLIKDGIFELGVLIKQSTKITFKANYLQKQAPVLGYKSIGVLGPGQYFGEESFFSHDYQLLWSKNDEEGQEESKKKTEKPIQRVHDIEVATRICNVQCQSQGGLLYKISSEDLISRFWDDKTVGIFVPMMIHSFKVKKSMIDKFGIDNEEKYSRLCDINNLNNILKGPDSFNSNKLTGDQNINKNLISLDSSQEVQEESKIHSTLSSKCVSPRKSISSQIAIVVKLPEKIQYKLSTRLNYNLLSKSNMEVYHIIYHQGNSGAAKNLELSFKKQLTKDQNAMFQFSQVFRKRNFSYSQVANYYQQKSFHDQDIMDQSSYRRQFFKFKERLFNVQKYFIQKSCVPVQIHPHGQQENGKQQAQTQNIRPASKSILDKVAYRSNNYLKLDQYFHTQKNQLSTLDNYQQEMINKNSIDISDQPINPPLLNKIITAHIQTHLVPKLGIKNINQSKSTDPQRQISLLSSRQQSLRYEPAQKQSKLFQNKQIKLKTKISSNNDKRVSSDFTQRSSNMIITSIVSTQRPHTSFDLSPNQSRQRNSRLFENQRLNAHETIVNN